MSSKRKTAGKVAINVGLVIVLVAHITPLLTMALNSVRSNADVAKQLIGIPTQLSWSNYVDAWTSGNYARAFLNTVIINCVAIVVVLFADVTAAYGLTKLNIFGKEFFNAYFVMGVSVPSFAIIVPLYFFFDKIGLVNNRIGMIIIYSAIFMPFTLLFMRSFYLGIPRSLEEAALIDGCSEAGALRRVTLPLAMPMVTTAALVVFVNSYNEFLFANVFLQQKDLRTVALSFYSFVGQYSSDLGTVFALSLIHI